MTASPLQTGSKRARRAIRRAGTDRTAQIVAGAATAAGAAVAAGKAVAARSKKEDDGPSRAYKLKAEEEPAAGIRRIAAGRADSAVGRLRGENGSSSTATAVHEARKDLKKLRSVLRLVRPRLDDELYRRENGRFRDAGRALGGARDAEVKLETLEALEERYEDEFPATGVKPLIEALEEERDELAAEVESDDGPRDDVATQIVAGGAVAWEWPLADDGWALVEPGLRRSYRRGRNRFADVRAEPTSENVHEWRKRVKDLWYHLRVLKGAWPEVVGETADQAHDLADLLGDHHDLAVLDEDVLGRKGLLATGDRKALRRLIEKRQDELLDPALELGGRIYAEKPKAFAGRLAAYWNAWRGA